MDRPRPKPDALCPKVTTGPRDLAIAEIADRQHGQISHPQLRATGLGDRGISHRVAAGKLHRVYRGAYSVGHSRITWRGRYMAAVLACGADAALARRPAGRLNGLRDYAGRMDVTIPGRRVRIPGIDTHRDCLSPQDVTEIDGIPCTSVARTIYDLANSEGDVRRTRRDIDRAEQLRVFDLSAIHDVLSRAGATRGARTVRAALGTETALTREEIEERMLAICDAAGFPRPRVNFAIHLGDGVFVIADFAWPDLRIIIETDGWATHGTRHAFVDDRRRDRRLRLAGWQVLRFTWHEIENEPAAVAEELAMHLALAS
jgi:hypothetical protein